MPDASSRPRGRTAFDRFAERASADLMDLALECGDREAIASRAAQLREAIGLEERI